MYLKLTYHKEDSFNSKAKWTIVFDTEEEAEAAKDAIESVMYERREALAYIKNQEKRVQT